MVVAIVVLVEIDVHLECSAKQELWIFAAAQPRGQWHVTTPRHWGHIENGINPQDFAPKM